MTAPTWYRRYLLSPHWLRFRELVYLAAGYRCVQCGWAQQPGEKWRLEVHHVSYAHLGEEHPEDVTVLCDRCYDTTHGLPPIERRGRARRSGDHVASSAA